jgi:DNA-directed RNA polymerase, mitochondrial
MEECIAQVVSKAAEIRAWLHSIVVVLAKHNSGLQWTLPTGFKVIHEYRKVKEARVSTSLGTLVVYRDPENPRMNLIKQRNAIVPNLIHSLDAAHMMTTVCELHNKGIRHFAMVHDSHGVHARDVPLMNTVLRDRFVHLYKRDFLRNFLRELEKRYPDIPFPPAPILGQLRIDSVLTSQYFFS